MTWAEFQIRSFGFKRIRKWQMFLTREIAYEVHTTRYLWGKKKPPKKEQFWSLGEKKNNGLSEEVIELFRKQKAEFNNSKNGNA